ncbi:hypothetical protein BGZ61DRAFT_508997 [Ilyonectria robusta]|uniref:uncharacterized protein n=1 Tax=Ilyonectria robusta TaxID=1079257 RepID=UPI001E8D5685|nr:uncharacterized protein BGZ61DRAFT_508997 [Ilyonectria robusta]KAH8672480.1 hypothetical protein BGZ61DRAFT_508997 [Ilyonectria robusta]
MDQLGPNYPLVLLQPMQQRSEVRNTTDDWTGVTSTAQRRKLQNRLNQRARRRRKMELNPGGAANSNAHAMIASAAMSPHYADSLVQAKHLVDRHGTEDARKDQTSQRLRCHLVSEEKQMMVRKFAQQAYVEYVAGMHCLGNLPTLMGVNVFYALSRNATALGVTEEWLLCDGLSPFSCQGPGLGEYSLEAMETPTISRPQSLHPTGMQLSIPHHPWIDLFPVPRFRDNVLVAITKADAIDEDELCYDMVEVTDGGVTDKAALIIWGEPWDPRAWEVSETFLRKWGSLLEGCWEMQEATNYWRAKRGEKRLTF